MMNRTIRTILHGPWPYWVGAVVLAILNILVFYVRREPWGVSLNIEFWSEWLGTNLGILDDRGFTQQELLTMPGTYLNLGVILGAFWSSLTASQFRWRPIRDKKFFISALVGGLLMGYGARIAYGCNIGALLNGIASGSLSGWIFALALFGGTWLGAKILVKYLV